MKRIFVTGAPGWMGNRFVELVANKSAVAQTENYELKCLALEGQDYSQLTFPNVEWVTGNICRGEDLRGVMEGCDCVVHIAGVVHPKNVKEFYSINTSGTKNLLDEAIRSEVKRFIYISSNSPAGFSVPGLPFDEKRPPNPYLNYGKSKLAAERLVNDAAAEGQIEAIILRPCWLYGPGQPPRQTTFFKMIAKGNPILFGSGQNKRSLSYVDSVVSAIVLSLEKTDVNGETFWIADERPYSMLEIYETVGKLMGVKNLNPRYIPGFSSWIFEQCDRVIQFFGLYQKEIHVAGEMARNIACDIRKAKKMLGYKPLLELEEGMRRSIDWCKEQKLLP